MAEIPLGINLVKLFSNVAELRLFCNVIFMVSQTPGIEAIRELRLARGKSLTGAHGEVERIAGAAFRALDSVTDEIL